MEAIEFFIYAKKSAEEDLYPLAKERPTRIDSGSRKLIKDWMEWTVGDWSMGCKSIAIDRLGIFINQTLSLTIKETNKIIVNPLIKRNEIN